MAPMRAQFIVVAAFAMALGAACGLNYRDTDSSPATARVAVEDFLVHDTLNVDLGDVVDWKSVTADRTGRGTLIFRFGDAFKGRHGFSGSITVYDKDANQLALERVEADEVRYDVGWPATKDTTYLIRVEGTAGKTPYEVTFRMVASDDPCAGIDCGGEGVCEEGRCVAQTNPDACNPACRSGRFCVAGRCERPCARGCDRGQICSRRQNRCVADPCFRKVCGSNQSCVGGVCRNRSAPPPAGCDPPCGDSERCKGRRCIPVPLGPIQAKIVQAIPQGKKTQLILNKGREHKVNIGQKGKINRVGPFVITEIFQYRCKAIIDKPATALGNAKTATIFRD